MSRNIIMRPVYNRPEMLYLSILTEKKAREYYDMPDDMLTIFVVEHGSPAKTVELIKSYPFPYKPIVRDKKYGLSMNILEGMKSVFKEAEDYAIYIEDDILVHKTYFQYMHTLLNKGEKFSVLSSYNKNDDGDVHEVYKGHHYAALAPLINRDFFMKYIYPCTNDKYYDNQSLFVTILNERYRKYWKKEYKYTNTMHWEQAGLLNRLVDVALIEDNMPVLMPRVNRHMHIGYYGKNRVGNLEGNSFKERLNNLVGIIKDPDKMYAATKSKEYNDYKTFSPKLDEWDGTLYIKEN